MTTLLKSGGRHPNSSDKIQRHLTCFALTELDAQPCGNNPERPIQQGACNQFGLRQCAHELGSYQNTSLTQTSNLTTAKPFSPPQYDSGNKVPL